jgi:predicted secreted protein
MKIISKIALLVTLCCGFAFAGNQMPTDPSASIVVKSGERAFIDVESTPSTGYQWFIGSYDTTLVAQVIATPLSSEETAVGSPGLTRWQLQLSTTAFLAPHRIAITLYYARPWAIDQPAKERTYYVVTVPRPIYNRCPS